MSLAPEGMQCSITDISQQDPVRLILRIPEKLEPYRPRSESTTFKELQMMHDSSFPLFQYLRGPLLFEWDEDIQSGHDLQLNESTRRLYFRGNLTSQDGDESAFCKSIVCKIDFASGEETEKLRNEAFHYCRGLRELQGKTVPEFYGFFEGRDREDKVTCILTQYHGIPFNSTDVHAIAMYRTKMFEIFQEIHEHGVHPRDHTYSGQNMVAEKDGDHMKLYFVDFEHAIEHEGPCTGAPAPWTVQCVVGGDPKLGTYCTDMMLFGEEIQVYAPGFIYNYMAAEAVEIEKARSVKEFAKNAHEKTTGITAEEMEDAQRSWGNYMDRWGHFRYIYDLVHDFEDDDENGDETETKGKI